MTLFGSFRLLALTVCLTACAVLPAGRSSPSLDSTAQILSVEEVVGNRQHLDGDRIRVRGCLLLMCRGRNCYGWLGTDSPQQVAVPNPAPQIAVENNARIQREVLTRQAAGQYPRMVVEGTFDDTLFPEGLRRRANIDPADNTVLVGPLRDAVIVQTIEPSCSRAH
jgi:hypothetical protein